MLIVFQIPFIDVRRFVSGDTFRLSVPAWPVPEVYKDFVRGFGAIKKRKRGGLDVWAGEALYCGAARAVRFQTIPEHLPEESRKVFSELECVFRRFLSDADTVSRFE